MSNSDVHNVVQRMRTQLTNTRNPKCSTQATGVLHDNKVAEKVNKMYKSQQKQYAKTEIL